MCLRESIPSHVDKKSGVPMEKKWVWGPQGGGRGLEFSRRRKGQMPPPSPTSLSLGHMFFVFFFFFFKSGTMIIQQTTQIKLCIRDSITTMYPA